MYAREGGFRQETGRGSKVRGETRRIERRLSPFMVKGGAERNGERLWVSRLGGAPIPVRVSGTDFLAAPGTAPND